jgi:hypothetical protein
MGLFGEDDAAAWRPWDSGRAPGATAAKARGTEIGSGASKLRPRKAEGPSHL